MEAAVMVTSVAAIGSGAMLTAVAATAESAAQAVVPPR